MYPQDQQPQQPTEPQAGSVSYPQAAPVNPNSRTNKLKLRWGLVCLIAPTVFFILAALFGTIALFIPQTTGSDVNGLFFHPSPLTNIMNILCYLFSGLWLLTALPGLVVGIILLATRRK